MPMAASPSASAAATISPGWEPPRRKEKLVVTASSAYAVMELTLVGWAKALALPLCILSFSCAVPTTFGHRAEVQMVGTAYDRNRRAEQPCQRLCPPYDSNAQSCSCEQPLHEPARRVGLARVESFAIEPEAAAVVILHQVVVAGRLRRSPPFASDALGPLRVRDAMHHAAPAEALRRPLGNERE